MNKLAILCVTLCVAAPVGVFARGGGGGGGMGHGGGLGHGAVTGGAFGSSPAAPRTNSAGTALSSGGTSGAMKGPELGTGDPAVDREDAKVDKMVRSICRGC